MSSASSHSSRPTPESPWRIALVEDQRKVLESWASLIGSFPEFRCVCMCSSGEEALRMIPPAEPHVVLMDIMLPGMSGIECSARLKAILPHTQTLILTASDDEELVFPALEAGADGYLLKQAKPLVLRAALLQLSTGGVPMTSGISRRVLDYFRGKAKARKEVVQLSARETEVLTLLSKGYSNKEIADKLSLSVETIHGYLKHAYSKMHVRSRAEAVAKYVSSGAQ